MTISEVPAMLKIQPNGGVPRTVLIEDPALVEAEVAVRRLPSLSAIVLLADRGPVSGCRLRLAYDPMGMRALRELHPSDRAVAEAMEVTSGPDGVARFPVVLPGVDVRLYGYLVGVGKCELRIEPLDPGESRLVRAQLESIRRIEGQVLDSRGDAVEGVTVEAYSSAPGSLLGEATIRSNRSGQFAFEVAVGSKVILGHKVTEESVQFWMYRVDLPVGLDAIPVNLILGEHSRRCRINAPVQTSGRRGILDVSAGDAGQWVIPGVELNREFNAVGLPIEGDQRVVLTASVQASGYGSDPTFTRERRTLLAGTADEVVTFDLGVRNEAAGRGSVEVSWSATTVSGDTSIWFYILAEDRVVRRDVAQLQAGRYRIEGVPVGTYEVLVIAADMQAVRRGVRVGSAELVLVEINSWDAQSARIEGTVRSSRNAGLVRVRWVFALAGPGEDTLGKGPAAFTKSDGSFVLERVPVGIPVSIEAQVSDTANTRSLGSLTPGEVRRLVELDLQENGK